MAGVGSQVVVRQLELLEPEDAVPVLRLVVLLQGGHIELIQVVEVSVQAVHLHEDLDFIPKLLRVLEVVVSYV